MYCGFWHQFSLSLSLSHVCVLKIEQARFIIKCERKIRILYALRVSHADEPNTHIVIHYIQYTQINLVSRRLIRCSHYNFNGFAVQFRLKPYCTVICIFPLILTSIGTFGRVRHAHIRPHRKRLNFVQHSKERKKCMVTGINRVKQ